MIVCNLQVMNNQEVVDHVRNIKDSWTAAKSLVEEALRRESRDDISLVVVSFH